MTDKTFLSLSHWGAFRADVSGGRVVSARPWQDGGGDARMIGAIPALVHSPSRIDRPHVRESFLRRREKAGGAGRGSDAMVPVDWDTALDLVAGELVRVRQTHGPASILGGSYGWSSAGRLHHARSQVRRFLAASGGYTDQVGNYSWGAAHAILPHVLGSADTVSSAATDWRTIADNTDVVVAFGGLNPKNWNVTSGGAGSHAMPRFVAEAAARGTRFVVVSPAADDMPGGIDALHIAPRPNTDTALMLALAGAPWPRAAPTPPFLNGMSRGTRPSSPTCAATPTVSTRASTGPPASPGSGWPSLKPCGR